MPTLDEAGQAFLNPALTQGYEELSAEETVTFTEYTQVVLPLDGYVFWLNTRVSMKAKASVHYSAVTREIEDETLSVNRIILTTNQEIQPFNIIAPDRLWIGVIDGVRFAFSQRGPYYKAAGLFHYAGDAVYPALASQLIDNTDQINDSTLIVSDSLPAWLQLKTYDPVWLAPPNPGITLYPSFLVPRNTVPPYGAVHIEPAQTRALQALASFDNTTTHSQLAADRVRITLYGLTNQQALDFLDLIVQYCRDDTKALGLMSTPIVRDDKRAQPEILAIAMRKTIDIEVSYYQSRINDIAREQIESVLVSFVPPPALMWDNGGVLMFVSTSYYPPNPTGLPNGALWSNNLVVSIAGTTTPDPSAPPVYFGEITAIGLQALTGSNLPLTPPEAGSLQLWNNFGVVSIA